MRLARDQDKVDEPAGGIANSDDLAVDTAYRTPGHLVSAADLANESQIPVVDSRKRAPAAY